MVRLEQQKSIIGMQFVLTFEFCSNEVPGAAVDTLKSASFACPVSWDQGRMVRKYYIRAIRQIKGYSVHRPWSEVRFSGKAGRYAARYADCICRARASGIPV